LYAKSGQALRWTLSTFNSYHHFPRLYFAPQELTRRCKERFIGVTYGLRKAEDINGSDVYQVQDIVREKDNFYVHAIDMVHSSITNVSAAREIARKDSKEFFVKSVVSHACDPDNPDLLGKLTSDATFTDDPGKTLILPYADVKDVDVVKSYLAEHKKDLPLAYKQSHAASGPIGLRARKNPNSSKVKILLPCYDRCKKAKKGLRMVIPFSLVR